MHEHPPIKVSANAGRVSAVARRVLGSVVVLALAGAVALFAHDRLLRTMIPTPRGACTAAAFVCGAVALVAGFFWCLARPVAWIIDAGGITQHGLGARRRDLRWADVRRVQRAHHGYEFIGRAGLTNIHLPWEAIPKDCRASVLAGVDAILREHFDFPPPPTGGIVWMVASIAALLAVVYGPPCLYLFAFLIPLVDSGPQTIMSWIWVHRLVAWNVDAASVFVPLILVAPSLAYLGIAAWYLCKRPARANWIVPKRPWDTDSRAKLSSAVGRIA